MRLLRTLFRAAVLTLFLAGASFVAGHHTTSPAKAFPGPRVPAPTASSSPVPSNVKDDERAAQALLDSLKSTYRLLDGVTIRMGATPRGEQAISYYGDGEIVVNPRHTADLDKIVGHEIWHIIDWRDNGRIDWGEAVPPLEAPAYNK